MTTCFLRRVVLSALVLFSVLVASGATIFAPATFLDHVKFLAAPEMKGRGTGTAEMDRAADYIAAQFRSYGLMTVENSYFQEFPVTMRAELGADNHLAYRFGPDPWRELIAKSDFQPFNFSDQGRATAPVVFAGYGITAPEYGYDDYEGLEVKGKLVLILRHEPQEFNEKSVFAGKIYTEHSQFFSKAVNAKLHGAAGVILVKDTANHDDSKDDLEVFGSTVGPNNAGLPFLQMKSDVAEKWFKRAGRDFDKVQEQIDQELDPESFAFPAELEVLIQTDLKRESKIVRNVLAYLPGKTEEYVIIGAHYDHLGLGEQFSLAPSLAGTPHMGADDNASGTAGVLELARWYSSRPQPERGVLFMAYAGEELGLLGSSFYTNNPLFPLDKAVAMLNMDMIGRLRKGKLYVGGSGTGSSLKNILRDTLKKVDLKVDYSDQSGYGSSDHTSFTAKQIPVLFFFSGLHEDYHKPSDTWDKIDAEGASEVLELVRLVTDRLLESERPKFVRVREPKNPHGDAAGAPGVGAGSGYGPYFGSIPDFAEVPNGVRFSDVRESSPAAKAGLKGGDILFEFSGKPISNLYDFTYALRASKPGDVVTVKVRRGKAVVEAKVALTERK